MFPPQRIIIALPIELGGKNVSVAVEVVYAPLDYNWLHGCTWFNKMTAFVLSIFRFLRFPHKGKIVTIDQIMFYTLDLGSIVGSSIPFINDAQKSYMSIGVGMFKYSSLMGTFPLPPPPPPHLLLPIFL
jgi:hypothetical protein